MTDRALPTLIRLARAETDARQQDLAALVARLAAFDARDGALAEEVDAERAAGGADPAAFAAFAGRIRQERAVLAQRRAALAIEEAALRAALSAAFLELKKLERLQEVRAEAAAAGAARAEGARLDDAALAQFARRGRG